MRLHRPNAQAFICKLLLLMEIKPVHINGAHTRQSSCFKTLFAILEHDTPGWFYSQ